MRYTKGPWELCDGGIFGPWDDDKDGKPTIAYVNNCGMNGPHTKEGYGNGLLLASAPELLEALQAFEKWWRLRNDQRTIEAIEPAMILALEAIAKATGKPA